MTPGELWRRAWYLLNRSRFERELEAEMAAHRSMMADRRQFGNLLKLREEARDVWGWGWLDRGRQDLAEGVRVLRRAPAFTLGAVLILSAGIGLNLTFFHLLDVTALQPPAVKEPATLVHFQRHGPGFMSTAFPYPATQFIRRHNQVLSAVLTTTSTTVAWENDAEPGVPALFVSANWFRELGYDAAVGRVFSEAVDERPDAPAAAVISHDFWRTRLAGDPLVIGRTARINGRVTSIVGVAPPALPDLNLRHARLWLLIHQIDHYEPGSRFETDWSVHETTLYGRLRPGVTPRAAAEGLIPTLDALATARPSEFKREERLAVATGDERFFHANDRREVWAVAALVGALTLLVLVVASANLANLVLSHAIGRLREFSVRAALGATRWRILRHLLVECTLVSGLGAAGGLALGFAGAQIFASVSELPPYLDLTPDWRLVAAALAAAFIAMLAFGFVPAWTISRRDLIPALKDGGQQTSAGLARARLRLALVGAQVVGCCALLIVAASMARSLQRLLATDLGFAMERVAVLSAPIERYGLRGEQARSYWSTVAAALGTHPDVDAIAFAFPPPLSDFSTESQYAEAPSLRVASFRVDPSYFSVLEIPLLAGRHLATTDDESAVIISKRVALTMYGTLDVLGRRYPRSGGKRTIVGVADDAQVATRKGDVGGEEYTPLRREDYATVALLARTRGNPADLLQPLRSAATAADARVLPRASTLVRDHAQALRAPRLASAIAGGVAALVLALACLGIVGVVAVAVQVRTKEIGIRRALGSNSPRILGVLVRQLLWPVGVGMFAGTAAGVAASRALGGPPLYLAVTGAAVPVAALTVFAAVALAAALIPAARALRVDPIDALRHE